MYDIPFFTPTRKEMAIAILGVFIFLVAIFSAGYMLGIRNVHDNGSGTQPIGQQLNEAGTNISNATSGIGQAENNIATGTESVEYLQGTVSTSTELIGQCKSIIEAIRRRGKADKVTH